MLKLLSTYIVVSITLFSFFTSKKIEEKADKVIRKYFEIEHFQKTPILISKTLNTQTKANFSSTNFFLISNKNNPIGYGYIGNAPSKTATYDYLVIFDTNLNIVKSKVLIYREDYGGEIGSKRWLKQFNGNAKTFIYNDNIIPISGATISVRSMTIAMNNLVQSITKLKNQNIL